MGCSSLSIYGGALSHVYWADILLDIIDEMMVVQIHRYYLLRIEVKESGRLSYRFGEVDWRSTQSDDIFVGFKLIGLGATKELAFNIQNVDISIIDLLGLCAFGFIESRFLLYVCSSQGHCRVWESVIREGFFLCIGGEHVVLELLGSLGRVRVGASMMKEREEGGCKLITESRSHMCMSDGVEWDVGTRVRVVEVDMRVEMGMDGETLTGCVTGGDILGWRREQTDRGQLEVYKGIVTICESMEWGGGGCDFSRPDLLWSVRGDLLWMESDRTWVVNE
ncbi:hypothetical protein Tco_1031622 [Tanacetum coccineum]|uniref:Uncharacterized protein n=1 Tax=Tanacetum coccineum TaxID=301880 RepID=A0ABQ5G9X2_9ASTR